jgi:glycolate oxidase
MITERFIQRMEEIVGKEYVRHSLADIELYSYDASLVTGKPGLIVFPGTTEEVAQVQREAHRAGIASVSRGFATNLSGGTIISDGGLVIVLSRFNRILEIHPESRYAVVQTGVTNLELQEAVAPLGMFYAPDPASQKVSTIGGNVGENSGGPRCLKYGVTSNHILGMKMVTADGEVVDIAGPALDPPGYDLRGLVVGSEGCVGIATEITVRITPKTESVITMLAIYDEIPHAARTVSEIIRAGILPLTLEMMDNTIIKAVEKGGPCGYPQDAAAVLIIEVEGMSTGLKEQADKIEEICMATQVPRGAGRQEPGRTRPALERASRRLRRYLQPLSQLPGQRWLRTPLPPARSTGTGQCDFRKIRLSGRQRLPCRRRQLASAADV